jgi:hypothetical protein
VESLILFKTTDHRQLGARRQLPLSCMALTLFMFSQQSLGATLPRNKIHKSKKNAIESSNTSDSEKAKSDSGAKSLSTAKAKSLNNRTVFRGLLGFFLGDSTTLTFGGDASIPIKPTLAVTSGIDYTKWGTEIISVSLTRFTGGASYVQTLNDKSVMRYGGRLGLASVAVSVALFDETLSESFMFTYGEGRVEYERLIGEKLTAGAAAQIPLFFSGTATGTKLSSLSIYGTLGLAL